jgi:flagellar protein FlaG
MVIQNINGGQGTLPGRLVGNDVPVAAVADPPAQTAPQTVPQPSPQPSSPSPEQVKKAVESINKALQSSNQGLEFSVDPNTKTPVVKVTDKETGKVISQYPSEQVLAIAQSIDQYLSSHQLQQGILLKQKA